MLLLRLLAGKSGSLRMNTTFAFLLAVQRILWRRIVHLDASSLLLVTIRERQMPAAFRFWGRQPQSHEMSPWRRWSMILVRRPRVEDMLVRKPLDVTNVEDHVES